MTEKIFVQTFLFVWFYIFAGAVVTYFVTANNFNMAVNFFLGGAVSVMLMSHNYRTTMKTAKTHPEELKHRALKNYFFRYAFYILILFIVYFRSDHVWYLIPVFIGFTSFKVVMVLNFMISRWLLARKGVDLDGD